MNALEAFLDELDRATGGPTEASQRNQRLYGVVGLGRASPLLGGLGSQLSAGTMDPALWPSLAALPRDRAARTVVTALATIDPDLSLPVDYAARWVGSRPRTLAQVAAVVARSHGTVLPSSPGRDPLEVALVRIRAQALGLSAPSVSAPVPPGQLELTIDDPITQLMVAFAAAEGAALPTGARPWTYRGRGGSARFQLLVALLGADPLVAELVDGLGRDLLGGLPDGEALLRVPPGAVAGETAIVGWRKGHPAARGTLTFVGPVVEMIPHGLAFASPGSLQLPYSQRLMARLGLPTTPVRLAGSQDGVTWQLLPSAGAAGLVTGTVEHFSFFAVVFHEPDVITYQSVLLPEVPTPADILDLGHAGPTSTYEPVSPYYVTQSGVYKLDWSGGEPLEPLIEPLPQPPGELPAGAQESAPSLMTTNGAGGGKLWRRDALGDWELLAGGGEAEEDVAEGPDAYFYDLGALVQDDLGRIFVVETVGGDYGLPWEDPGHWDPIQRVSIRMIDGAAPHGVVTIVTGEPTWTGDGPAPAMDLRIAGAADLATGAVGVSATQVLFIADPGNDRVWAVNVDPREEPVDLGGLMLGPWEMVRVMGASEPSPCIEGCYTRGLERYCADPGYPDDTEDLGTYGLELVLRAPSGVAVADGDLVVSDLCKWRVVMAALQDTGVEPGTKEEPWLPTAFLSGDPHQDPPEDGRDPRSRLPGQLAWRDLQPLGVGQLAVRSACEDWAAPTCLQLICLQDSDCDGLGFHEDNCLTHWNPDQTDSDLDDYGAACDCNDGDPTVNPGALELCDGIDQNCDGSTDEGHPQEKWYRDADGDGYGASASEKLSCGQPLGYVSLPGDCLDDNEAVHPAAVEVCNGIDDNCDSVIDEFLQNTTWYRDGDGDGYPNLYVTIEACAQPPDYMRYRYSADCDDADAQRHPGLDETCPSNGIDNNCDGEADPAYAPDDDMDGALDPFRDVIYTCEPPPGYALLFPEAGEVAPIDCDDGDPTVRPGLPELCDGKDNDCDGDTDEGISGDRDGDEVPDDCDNCPYVSNPAQENADAALETGGDIRGDACDSDDSDSDGLSDMDEYMTGTNALTPDTDGDGLSDQVERDLGLDPTRADTDGDGVVDLHQVVDLDDDGVADQALPEATDGLRMKRLWYVEINGHLHSDIQDPVMTSVDGRLAGGWGLARLPSTTDMDHGSPTEMFPVALHAEPPLNTPSFMTLEDHSFQCVVSCTTGYVEPVYGAGIRALRLDDGRWGIALDMAQQGGSVELTLASDCEEPPCVYDEAWAASSMPVLRNPRLACVPNPSPIGDPPAFSLVPIVAHVEDYKLRSDEKFMVRVSATNVDCDGLHQDSTTVTTVNLELWFHPIFISYPHDVQGGTRRTAHSQFTFTASAPGELLFEGSTSLRAGNRSPAAPFLDSLPNHVRSYLAAASPEQRLHWTAPMVGNVQEPNTAPGTGVWLCWGPSATACSSASAADRWGTPVLNPLQPLLEGGGLDPELRYRYLPAANQDFGRKTFELRLYTEPITNARMRQPGEPFGAGAEGDYQRFIPVDSIEVEVFWPRCLDAACTGYAANHPGGDANKTTSVAVYRQPNWLYYWAHVADVDDGFWLHEVPYRYDGQQVGTRYGKTPKVLDWVSFSGPVDEVVFYPRLGIPGGNDSSLVGISRFLATARHERVHARQVGCNNYCTSQGGPSRYASPGKSTDPATGWSFNQPLTSSLWNHYADVDVDGSMGPGDISLDSDGDDSCDPGYCASGPPSCEPMLARNFADLCDPDPMVDGGSAWHLPRDETERQAYAAAQERTRPEELETRDWGSPGRQHLDQMGVTKDRVVADAD